MSVLQTSVLVTAESSTRCREPESATSASSLVAKALALQAGYRGFESLLAQLVQVESVLTFIKWTRSVAVITPPCHGGDRRFESGRVRHFVVLVSQSCPFKKNPFHFCERDFCLLTTLNSATSSTRCRAVLLLCPFMCCY